MRKNLWKKRILSVIVVALLITSIVSYTKFSVKAQVNLTTAYFTKVQIPPRTKITENMILTRKVSSDSIPPNAITNKKDILGKYTLDGYGYSVNSYFYKTQLINKDELPDYGILQLKKGEVAFPLLVDLETSLGNSIIPNSKVDLYFRTLTKEGTQSKVIYGKLVSQVRVVSVKDAEASNVFDSKGNQVDSNKDNQSKSLAKIYIFAIPEKLNALINKAKLLGEIIPIATGDSYNQEAKTTGTQNEVIKYIEDASYDFSKKDNIQAGVTNNE